jgi:hypothetical protein
MHDFNKIFRASANDMHKYADAMQNDMQKYAGDKQMCVDNKRKGKDGLQYCSY